MEFEMNTKTIYLYITIEQDDNYFYAQVYEIKMKDLHIQSWNLHDTSPIQKNEYCTLAWLRQYHPTAKKIDIQGDIT